MGVTLLVLGLLVLLSVPAAVEASAGHTVPAPPDELVRSCRQDEDCVAVLDGCCDCANGGWNTAINRQFQDTYLADLTQRCRNVSCLAVVSDHPSCFASPSCLDGTCGFRSNPE